MADAAASPGDVLRALNAAWAEGRPRDTAALLREDAVFVAPGGAGRLEGRDACVASYVEFLENASVDAYEERDLAVDVFGDTAAATLAWRVAFTMGGTSYDETGTDVYALVRGADGWKVAWRTTIPDVPSRGDGGARVPPGAPAEVPD